MFSWAEEAGGLENVPNGCQGRDGDSVACRGGVCGLPAGIAAVGGVRVGSQIGVDFLRIDRRISARKL